MGIWNGWERAVLARIGAPPTVANIAFLDTWARYEGGTAAFNPMNTTQPYPGATDYNDAGVKEYPNKSAGTFATADTLENGYYPTILQGLRNGFFRKMSSIEENVRVELTKWGTVDFANNLRAFFVEYAK